jgi:hypothetical protein
MLPALDDDGFDVKCQCGEFFDSRPVGSVPEHQETTTAVKKAADDLFAILGHSSEDALEEAYAATWPGGEDDWWDGAMAVDQADVAEAHREATFRQVMAALARLCDGRAASPAAPGEART